MGTLTERYPDAIARGAVGGHGHFSTNIVVSAGGYEDRSSNWEDARGRWEVARAIEASGTHNIARAHLMKARGRFHQFRFKDWADFTCERTGLDKGRLTGSGTTWQLNKVYGTDEASFEYVRPLKRIVSGSVQIWRNTVLQTLTTHYTVNNDTGVVTSVSSWTGDTLEMACEFDVLVRYDIDEYMARLVNRRLGGEVQLDWDRVTLVEVRE